MIKLTNKEYYDKNKSKIKQQIKNRNVMILCECGKMIYRNSKPKHILSKQHLIIMDHNIFK